MKGFPDLPPIWLLAFMAATWALAEYAPVLQVEAAVLPSVGRAIIGVGLLVILWAAIWFFRRKTTIEPHHTPKALISEGPFRWSRNPIYLALVIILVGYVIGQGALSPVILPPIFAWVLHSRFVLPEEAALRSAFGDEAERYFTATRRWL